MEGWYSSRCRLTWRLKGTKYNRMFFQLVPSTLPIEGIGFGLYRGLLPTVAAQDATGIKNLRKDATVSEQGFYSMSLTHFAVSGLLPTPRACESIERRNMKTIVDKVENGGDVTLTTLAKYKGGIMLPTPRANESTESVETINNRREKTGSGMMNLTAIARLLPTPATRDYKGARTEESLEESGRNHTNSLPDSFAQLGTTSQLNPRFVAEMMGFPPNWLELPFLNTETNQ